MSEPGNEIDHHLFQLVLSLQAGAMQQMGKIISPITGKTERDLMAAKYSIDMLAMLEAKTKGNLTDDEQKLVSHSLYELRLNYVDEMKKDDEGGGDAKSPEKDEAKKGEAESSGEDEGKAAGPESSGEAETAGEAAENTEEPEAGGSDAKQ